MRLIDPIRLKQALAVSAILKDKKTIEQIIDEQPTIEPERKKGKWKKGIGENGATTSMFCSMCNYENKHWYDWNFCPNCGADMRGEQDENR